MPKKKQASSSARMKAAGKRPSLVWLDEAAHASISRAAEVDGRPVTQFMLFHALAAAKKILAKSSVAS